MRRFTKRNHYNPCFWTALWNPEYFHAWSQGTSASGAARNQAVLVLNLRGDRVYRSSVERVHFSKNLGVAEITPNSMRAFCGRWFPDEYQNLSAYVDANPEHLFLDFEDILAGIENMEVYGSLLDVARTSQISSPEQKGFLTCCLVLHSMRSHEMMSSMIDAASVRGLEKWEYFWLLKNSWSDKRFLARAATPLAMGRWTLFRTPEPCFPLPDSPVMIGENSLMAVLSPCLLLEIDLLVQCPEDHWVLKDRISSSKYWEFRRRAIGNTFKELIFGSRSLLEDWQRQPICRQRIAALNDPDRRANLVAEASARVMWGINGFGRVPPDFETWIGDYVDD